MRLQAGRTGNGTLLRQMTTTSQLKKREATRDMEVDDVELGADEITVVVDLIDVLARGYRMSLDSGASRILEEKGSRRNVPRCPKMRLTNKMSV